MSPFLLLVMLVYCYSYWLNLCLFKISKVTTFPVVISVLLEDALRLCKYSILVLLPIHLVSSNDSCLKQLLLWYFSNGDVLFPSFHLHL